MHLTEHNFDLDLGNVDLLLSYNFHKTDDEPTQITFTNSQLIKSKLSGCDTLPQLLADLLIQHTDLVDLIAEHEDAKRPGERHDFAGHMTIDQWLDDPRRQEISR